MNCGNQKALIYSIQRYCIHDGPGIRTTIFFKGCQMKCPWCANPESRCGQPEIAFFQNKCRMCGACEKACKPGAIDLAAEERIDRSKCTLCGDCVYVCPYDAYSIFGESISCEELVTEALKDRAFYRRSGGGVTVSGGEPSMQADFLEAFLGELRRQGVHTAMETNGFISPAVLDRLVRVVSLFLYDIKHMDTKKHEEYTGLPNARVLTNMRRLALELKVPVTMRVPLIPGFNDDDENLKATAAFAKELSDGSLTGVHLLKFHNMASGKYSALWSDYKYAKTQTQTPERLEEIKRMFEQLGVTAQLGG